MELKSNLAVIDFETEDNDGASTEYWKPDFRVISMAVTYFDGTSAFASDEEEARVLLAYLVAGGYELIAHNAPFEMGVIACRFSGLTPIWHADTMRLAQVYDNGGDKFELTLPPLDEDLYEPDDDLHVSDNQEPKSLSGLGLVKCVQRILKEPDHKAPYYLWLRNNIDSCKKGREGQYLHQLPPDLLRKYNVADTEVTLRLYKFLVEYFRSINYDWRLDHRLYFSTSRFVVQAKIRGILVNRPVLEGNKNAIAQEIDSIAREFHERFAGEIRQVERIRLLAEVKKLKTFRGKRNFVRRLRKGSASAVKKCRFNVGSNKQLEMLFCGILGMEAKFQTAKGAPSFRSAVLSQWGEGGLLLQKRRKRLLVLKQSEALLALSAVDSRWHLDIKVAAAATGRMAGGSH